MNPPVWKTDLWCPNGHFNEDQAEFVARLLVGRPIKVAIETGFATGRSCASVLWYADPKPKLYSIDINLDYLPEGREMARRLTERYPHYLTILEGNSRTILPMLLPNLDEDLDWAIVDGDHSYEGCLFDLVAIWGFLRPGGIMIVDDYFSGPPNGCVIESVNRAVEDWFKMSVTATTKREFWSSKGKGMIVFHKP